MHWPDPAAMEESGWGVEPPETEAASPENPIIKFTRRLFWVLITLLVILSLLAPLLLPIFRPRQVRPKDSRDGLQARRQIPATVLFLPQEFL